MYCRTCTKYGSYRAPLARSIHIFHQIQTNHSRVMNYDERNRRTYKITFSLFVDFFTRLKHCLFTLVWVMIGTYLSDVWKVKKKSSCQSSQATLWFTQPISDFSIFPKLTGWCLPRLKWTFNLIISFFTVSGHLWMQRTYGRASRIE